MSALLALVIFAAIPLLLTYGELRAAMCAKREVCASLARIFADVDGATSEAERIYAGMYDGVVPDRRRVAR